MKCLDCPQIIPNSTYKIRCFNCYKKKNQMECIDCEEKIPYSKYKIRCLDCFKSNLQKPPVDFDVGHRF